VHDDASCTLQNQPGQRNRFGELAGRGLAAHKSLSVEHRRDAVAPLHCTQVLGFVGSVVEQVCREQLVKTCFVQDNDARMMTRDVENPAVET
jgi:hypothetical protein